MRWKMVLILGGFSLLTLALTTCDQDDCDDCDDKGGGDSDSDGDSDSASDDDASGDSESDSGGNGDGNGCADNQGCQPSEYCMRDGCGNEPGTCTPRPELCTMDYTPVCGCDGNTYGNRCEASTSGVNVDHEGSC
jgi:hypothetical protein